MPTSQRRPKGGKTTQPKTATKGSAEQPRAPSRGRRRAGTKGSPRGAESLGDDVRLQKILARAGVSSRRGGELLITAGRVRVNGRIVTELGTRIDPASDRVTVDGQAIEVESPVYIVLNKPDGTVSSGEPNVDERGRSTVVSLLKGVRQRVFPVGRLDFHTRGVLLLTNDGELASRLLHPKYKVPKTYHAKFQGQVSTEALSSLERGVTLEDGTVTEPLQELLVMRDTESNLWVQLTLTQGLYRQVRRMGEAIGHPVLKLLRVAFADITSEGLADGEWRYLREVEVAELKQRTGLAGS